MKLAIAQVDCQVGDLAANTKMMLEYVGEAAANACDVVVLPEMTDTGYLMPVVVEKAAAWESDAPFGALREAAAENSIHVVAGLSERDGNTVYNGIATLGPTGELVTKYRKTHLVTVEPMFEHHHLGSGDELVVGPLAGTQAGYMTCYDLRFPEVARCLALDGAQMIVLPAAFPRVRLTHWTTLIQARAIENQVFVVAANRVGSDGPGLTFCGASRVVDPYGTIVASASEIDETLLVTEIDLERVQRTRARMQVMKDRRPELYGRTVVDAGGTA